MVFDTYIISLYSTFIFIFVRLLGLFVSMPLIGSGILPMRIRVVLTLVLTLTLLPIVPVMYFESFFQMIIQVILSFIAGILIGFLMQVPFQAFITGGQVMAYQMGLGFALVVDPITGNNTPSVSQFYFLLMAFTFLFLDVHLSLIELIVNSFEYNYLALLLDPLNIKTLAKHFAEIFVFGLQVALMMVFMMLITNIALALMTKAAPSVNIFSIGFPLMIITGILVLYLTFFTAAPLAVQILDSTLGLLEI